MNREDIFELIAYNCCQIIPRLEGHLFQRSDRLKDLGANSIDRTEILMITMDSLSLKMPLVEMFGAKNIGELVDRFYEKLKSIKSSN